MSADATFSITTGAAPAPATPATTPGVELLGAESSAGFGLLRPFVRDQKGDFAAAGGARLVAACAGQVLGTRSSSQVSNGELPWRTSFGSRLHLLRHRRNDATTRELARVYSAGALARWSPRLRVVSANVKSETVSGQGEVAVEVSVRFDLAASGAQGSRVLLPGLEASAPLA